MSKLTFELQGATPQWAKEARWYYENALGEQWIATVQDDHVIISGLDIDWSEIKLDLQQTKEAYEVIIGKKQVDYHFMENPIAEWILDAGESLWVASVLYAAIDLLQMNMRAAL